MLRVIPLLFMVVCGCAASKREGGKAVIEPPQTTVVQTPTPAEQTTVLPEVDPRSNLQPLLWKRYPKDMLPDLAPRIVPSKFQIWKCEFDKYLVMVSGDTAEAMLPTNEGLVVFIVTRARTMAPLLEDKFPNIRSYRGKSAYGNIYVRLDINDEGVFAEFTSEGSPKWLLAPYLRGSRTFYALYEESTLAPQPRDSTFR